MSSIRACGITDPGLARLHNEDAFRIDGGHGIYVVADGMGGHSHGEVASQIAVDTICSRLTGSPEEQHAGRDNEPLRPQSRRFKDAIECAHEAMLEAIREDLSLQGMGTTVAGILVRDGVVTVAHVGDSRVYRLRGTDLDLLTRDHTWVNEQVLAGFLSEDQARSHPLRNVVTRALGGEADVTVDVQEREVQVGDLYLICSDGLTAMLTDDEIRKLLVHEDSLEQTCKQLVSAANERGGIDNITVVLARIEDRPAS